MVAHTPAITTNTRWTYGSGGAAYGVFYNSHYFVLAYYSQVLGLNPALAGFAITLGLVLDAITDPLIGYLSDNTKSRWGRRHPWLVASVLPFAASFYFLWHPPAAVGTETGLLTGGHPICRHSITPSPLHAKRIRHDSPAPDHDRAAAEG